MNPAVFIATQNEEMLLLAVDEAQEKLQEQKQQLLEKEKQVEAAKAEVEQKTKSVQGLSKCEQPHHGRDGTPPECLWFRHTPPTNPRSVSSCQRAGEAPAGGDERRVGIRAETSVQTQPSAGLQDPGGAHRSAVGEPRGDQRGPGGGWRSRWGLEVRALCFCLLQAPTVELRSVGKRCRLFLTDRILSPLFTASQRFCRNTSDSTPWTLQNLSDRICRSPPVPSLCSRALSLKAP